MTLKKSAYTSAFTLIEMLIVLAMITVILGVLVSMLNPKAQFNKARDRTIESVMAKMVLAINSYRNVYDEFPAYDKFVGSGQEIDGTPFGTPNATDHFVLFDVPGVSLPSTCDSDGWQGAAGDSDQCYFYYDSDDGCIAAKSWRDSTMYYRFDLGQAPIVEYVDDSTLANCGT